MPNIKIIQKRIGYSNATLLIKGPNSVLIDTGVKGNMKKIELMFGQAGIEPTDIKVIVLTHTHYDHTGNLPALVEYTGAQVLVHKNEFRNLQQGFTPIPKGIGRYPRFISGIGRKLMPRFTSPPAFTAQLVNNAFFDLNPWNINAKVISTPGHTLGSQSVVVEKNLISGDTFVNMRNGQIFPPFADNPELLLQTWRELFKLGIKTIYPGHGKAFPVAKAIAEYKKWCEKFTLAYR
ncbi:MBL fold metallo-hydrolase [uncultured Draconibacterium sp.]|uniref:MBL fold metallo-hydrolase n=1 Tax=uncultured Draconibacterium sp. TaxID=1573823 RepID=UPI003260FF26